MKKSFNDSQLDNIKKELNILPKVTNDFAIEKTEPFDIFAETTDKLYIPKFYGIKKFKDIKNSVKAKNPLDLKFKGELRDYQKEIVKTVLPQIKENGGGLLSVPTGRGKTVLGLYLATQLKCRTLIVVHKEFLMNQWIERIKQYTDCSIGKIQQNKVDINKDFVVGMLQSISMKDYDVDIFSKFDFVIYDECHHLSSRVFSQALLKINTPYTLGLSATPNRADKTEKVFYWFLGDMMYKEEATLAHKVKVEMHNYSIKHKNFRDVRGKNGKAIQPIIVTNLSEIEKRNAYIYDTIYNLKEKAPSRKILVLSGRKDQLETLNTMLKEVFDGDIGFYVGGMKEKDLKISESKDILLATYEMVSEGLDIQALDTMVMATPKAGINQTVGRILRKKPEDYENQPLIIDIVDQIPTMIFMGMARKKLYTSRNYEISYLDIKENTVEKTWEHDYVKEKETKFVKGNDGFIDSEEEDEKEKEEAFKLLEKETQKSKISKTKKVSPLPKSNKPSKDTNGFVSDSDDSIKETKVQVLKEVPKVEPQVEVKTKKVTRTKTKDASINEVKTEEPKKVTRRSKTKEV